MLNRNIKKIFQLQKNAHQIIAKEIGVTIGNEEQ